MSASSADIEVSAGNGASVDGSRSGGGENKSLASDIGSDMAGVYVRKKGAQTTRRNARNASRRVGERMVNAKRSVGDAVATINGCTWSEGGRDLPSKATISIAGKHWLVHRLRDSAPTSPCHVSNTCIPPRHLAARPVSQRKREWRYNEAASDQSRAHSPYYPKRQFRRLRFASRANTTYALRSQNPTSL